MTCLRLPSLDKKKLNHFFLCSCFLTTVSLLTLIFKAVSDSAWNVPYESRDFPIQGAIDTDALYVNLYDIRLISWASDGLAWTCIGISLAIAALSIYVSQRARAKGPLHCTRLQRGCFYFVYYAAFILTLTTFCYLTYMHSRSDHFSPTTSFFAIYNGFLQFDRETWVCDLSTSPNVTDLNHVLDRICVGETATRGLLLVLALATAMLAGLLEWERRNERTILRSWKAQAREEHELYGM